MFLQAAPSSLEPNRLAKHLKPHHSVLCYQVALYQLAGLQEQQQRQQQDLQQQTACRSSSPVDLQQHQQQQEVPKLPPVAIVRLPGKISSIAWCPDMEGVLSIGDYDGTLTQVGLNCSSGFLKQTYFCVSSAAN